MTLRAEVDEVRLIRMQLEAEPAEALRHDTRSDHDLKRRYRCESAIRADRDHWRRLSGRGNAVVSQISCDFTPPALRCVECDRHRMRRDAKGLPRRICSGRPATLPADVLVDGVEDAAVLPPQRLTYVRIGRADGAEQTLAALSGDCSHTIPT